MNEENGKFVPNYEIECINCEQVPTVSVVSDGDTTDLELCGPCCWGEASTLDVTTWN